MSFRRLRLASILLAVAGPAGLLLFDSAPAPKWSIPALFWFGALWSAVVTIAVFKYGRRGLWLLIGAPLALGPAILLGMAFMTARGD